MGDNFTDAFGAEVGFRLRPVADIAGAVDPGEQGVGVAGIAEEILVPVAVGHPQRAQAVQSGAGYRFQKQSIRLPVGFPSAGPGIVGTGVNRQRACHREVARAHGQFVLAAAAAGKIAKTVPGGIHIQGVQMDKIDASGTAEIQIVGGGQFHGVDGIGQQAGGGLSGVFVQQKGEIDPLQIVVGGQARLGRHQDVGALFHDLDHVVGKQAQRGIQLLNTLWRDDRDAVGGGSHPEALVQGDVCQGAHVV